MAAASTSTPRRPDAFLCPICGGLMEDPVVLLSGQSFDRRCIELQIRLGRFPLSTVLIPNHQLRSAILEYTTANPPQPPLSPSGEGEELRHPPHQPLSPISPEPPDRLSHRPTAAELVRSMTSPDEREQEEGLQLLRRETRENREQRSTLCTPRLLSALLPHLESERDAARSDATAALVNLSLEPPNRHKVVDSGAVPKLIASLRSGHPELRSHAAAAFYALSEEKSLRLQMGATGVIAPLVEMFSSESEAVESRHSAARAIHYLCSSCESNASKVLWTGAASTALRVAEEWEDGELGRAALLILMALASSTVGRTALMSAGAAERMVDLVRTGRGGGRKMEVCLRVLYGLSKEGPRFWVKARAAGLQAALEAVWACGEDNEMAKAAEVARRLLLSMREDEGGCGGGGGGGGGGGRSKKWMSGPARERNGDWSNLPGSRGMRSNIL